MTKIIAHRGSKGTHPENTLAAFKEAIRVGADGIELDVQLSKDNHLIVIHDETVDRTTNGYGEISQLTLAELKQLDAGNWFKENPIRQEIPTLEEVLQLLVDEQFQGVLNIELKTDKIHYQGIEKILVQLMQSQNWPFEYIYSSFYFPSLEKIEEIAKDSKLALVFFMSQADEELAEKTSFIEGMHPHIQWVMDHIDRLVNFPKAIRPWTVNGKEQMMFCFKQNITAFHTDFPEEATQIRKLIQNKDE